VNLKGSEAPGQQTVRARHLSVVVLSLYASWSVWNNLESGT